MGTACDNTDGSHRLLQDWTRAVSILASSPSIPSCQIKSSPSPVLPIDSSTLATAEDVSSGADGVAIHGLIMHPSEDTAHEVDHCCELAPQMRRAGE